MRDVCDIALNAASLAGASYADVRVVESREQHLATRNGRVAALRDHAGTGLAVRSLVRGAWGFAATADLRPDAIARTAASAAVIAQNASLVNRGTVRLASAPAAVGEWDGPLAVDPFLVPLPDRIAALIEADAIARRRTSIRACGAQMTFVRRTTWFASSDGAFTRQTTTTSGAGIVVTAVSATDLQVRSWPSPFGGQLAQGGWERVEELDLIGHAEQIASEAEELLAADECPSGRRTLILDTRHLALQIHETCARPAEADRVLAGAHGRPGGSFLTREARGVFALGSPLVHLVVDPTRPGGLGTCAWDDDGVAPQVWDLVRDGVLQDLVTTRDTAAAMGDETSRGCARAGTWSRAPGPQAGNVTLRPGDAGTLEELIGATDDGIYMESPASWSFDDARLRFRFGCELAWEIRGGRRTRLLRNGTYEGTTPDFWRRCDAVCGPDEFRLWGLRGGDGDDLPGPPVPASYGAAPARFRDVAVGVGYAS